MTTKSEVSTACMLATLKVVKRNKRIAQRQVDHYQQSIDRIIGQLEKRGIHIKKD